MTSARMTLPGLMSLAFLASPAEAQLATEMKLTDAGFVMRTAKTAKHLERLNSIPARRLVARTKDGVRRYFYADPAGCQCVLVGDERAMNNYRDMVKPPPLPPGVKDFEGAGGGGGVNVEREMIHEMNADGEPAWEDDILNPDL
jgi:hypothetical protein